jgi:hypothetical protein
MNQLSSSLAILTVPIVFFGFYIGPGRTDQYWLLLLATMACFIHRLSRVLKFSLIQLLVAGLFVGIGLINTIMPLDKFFSKNLLLVLAQMENYFGLIVVYFLWASIFERLAAEHHAKICRLFVYCVCVNTVLIMLGMLIGPQIFDIFDNTFVNADRLDCVDCFSDVTIRLSQLSFYVGRYSGVFTQVSDAGVITSLATILLCNQKIWSDRIVQIFVFGLVLAGGVLSGSKIFFMTLTLTLLFFSLRSTKAAACALGLASLVLGVYYFNVGVPWQFSRLINNLSADNVFHIYTSFRFTEDSFIMKEFENIYNGSSLIGRGFGYLASSDNAMLEVFSIGGFLGVALYLLYTIVFFFDVVRFTRFDFYSIALPTIVVFSSLAAPILTGNKIGFFLIICSLCFSRNFVKP